MRIEFGQGLPGREPKDQAYEPFNFNFHAHGPALNLHIITEFMCDELVNKCGLKNDDQRFADCKAIKESIGTVKGDGSKADLWNAQFGFTTTYASNPCQGGAGTGGHGDGIPKGSSPTSSSNPSGNSSGGNSNTTTPVDSTTNYPDSQSSENQNSSGGESNTGKGPEDDC
ncbi:hypothetical protein DFH28DRAFT_511650 [Melampsora americana]|nr:hypothetical protein DFH28DRAFT_511650 [Melampsora americana]